MKTISLYLILLVFCALPRPSFAEEPGPRVLEPPAQEKIDKDADLSDFMANRNSSVYLTVKELDAMPDQDLGQAPDEYEPPASESRAMELCEKDPSELNRLALGILRGSIALEALEAYRAKNPRPSPDEAPELRKALAYALSASEICPERPNFFYILARVYGAFGANSYTQSLAREACEKALELDPSHAETLVFLAGLEFQDESFEDAVTHFLKAFAQKPELFDLNVMPLFGATCLISGKTAEGEAFVQSRLNADGGDGTALFALAQFQRAKGNKKLAIETLKKAISAWAQNPSAAAYANKIAALWEAEK